MQRGTELRANAPYFHDLVEFARAPSAHSISKNLPAKKERMVRAEVGRGRSADQREALGAELSVTTDANAYAEVSHHHALGAASVIQASLGNRFEPDHKDALKRKRPLPSWEVVVFDEGRLPGAAFLNKNARRESKSFCGIFEGTNKNTQKVYCSCNERLPR